MTGVVDLTLAVKNGGHHTESTGQDVSFEDWRKIGTATRLKAMSAEANADWESFVCTHRLRITDDDGDPCEDDQGNVWSYAPNCASWHVKNRKRLRRCSR